MRLQACVKRAIGPQTSPAGTHASERRREAVQRISRRKFKACFNDVVRGDLLTCWFITPRIEWVLTCSHVGLTDGCMTDQSRCTAGPAAHQAQYGGDDASGRRKTQVAEALTGCREDQPTEDGQFAEQLIATLLCSDPFFRSMTSTPQGLARSQQISRDLVSL